MATACVLCAGVCPMSVVLMCGAGWVSLQPVPVDEREGGGSCSPTLTAAALQSGRCKRAPARLAAAAAAAAACCAVLCCVVLCWLVCRPVCIALQLEGVMHFTACVMGLACLAFCSTAWPAAVLPGLLLYLTATTAARRLVRRAPAPASQGAAHGLRRGRGVVGCSLL